MPGTFLETARNKLRALKGASLVSDIDEGFQRLAEDVDEKMASYWQGTHAARPAAGQSNRFYKETDTGLIFHDTGTVWEPIVGPGIVVQAGVTRNWATVYTPSNEATNGTGRPVLVALTAMQQNAAGVEAGNAEIFVDGKWVQTWGGGGTTPRFTHGTATFVVKPGGTWEAKKVGGLETALLWASYTTL